MSSRRTGRHAPLTIGSTTTETPLTYDFWGFPQRYYEVTYDAPGAPDLAARIEALMPDNEPVAHDPHRRLDHGAYVPLTVMYPDAAIPVLQISMPTLDPQRLLRLGERLRPLRDEGVLDHRVRVHHARPAVSRRSVARTPRRRGGRWSSTAGPPIACRRRPRRARRFPAPGARHAVCAPDDRALRAAVRRARRVRRPEQSPRQVIDGYWMGLAKRSIELA